MCDVLVLPFFKNSIQIVPVFLGHNPKYDTQDAIEERFRFATSRLEVSKQMDDGSGVAIAIS